MSLSITRRTAAIALLLLCFCTAMTARSSDPKPLRDATIPAETKTRLTLQGPINSKLSEAGDIITATLNEAMYVEGEMVLPRGAEFYGRIVQISPAKRGQRSSSLSIDFERVITPSGAVPISAQVTAIDDWDREATLKADNHGKMKGGHQGARTVDNIGKGGSLGFSAGLIGLVLGGASGASGRQALGIGGASVAVGMIGGALFTKGTEIRVTAGSILRIKFLKGATLPLLQQPITLDRSDEQKERVQSEKP